MRKIILDKIEIKRLYSEEKMTGMEISKIFNVSVSPIFKIIKEMGIARRKNKVIRDTKKYILKRICIDKNGCWNYPYSVSQNGYARIWNKGAHRISYECFRNKIPDQMTIDHLCKNKICVNPEHLEVVTAAENAMRGNCPPALNSRKINCKRGHSLSGENLAIYAGKRQCKKCFNIRWHKYNDK